MYQQSLLHVYVYIYCYHCCTVEPGKQLCSQVTLVSANMAKHSKISTKVENGSKVRPYVKSLNYGMHDYNLHLD